MWGVPLVLLCLYLYASSEKEAAQRTVRSVTLPLRCALGRFFAWFPFSVMELLYTLLGAGLLAFLVLLAVQLVRRNGKLRLLARRAAVLALTALYLLCGCLWLWGLDYRAYSFSEKESFYAPGVAAEDLYAAAEHFVENAASLAYTVPRDSQGNFAADMDACFADSIRVYDQLEKRFPSLDTPSQKPKKMALYSGLMSHMGFTGVYFCFTGESNINMEQPPAFIPFTIAHELAHQKGVASEQECNFLGVAAGISSDLPVYRYSCFLAGAVHLTNALYKASPERWQALQKKISVPMQKDLDANNAFWSARRSQVTHVSKKLYDTYLKANGQPLGIESYGACVDLLVAYYQTDMQ